MKKRFRTGIDESENTVHTDPDAVSAVPQDTAALLKEEYYDTLQD